MATEPDKVDSGVLGTLIAALAFGVLLTALGITALVRTDTDELEAERSNTNETFAAVRGAQEADLYLPPAYMDEKAGIVRLPIDRAMQMVVRDLRRNPQSATAEPPPTDHADGDGAVAGAEPEAGAEGATAAPGSPAEEEQNDKDKGDTSVKQPPKPPAPPKPQAPKPAPAAPKAPAPKAPAPKPPAPKPPAPVPAQPKPAAPKPVAPAPAPAPVAPAP